MASTTSSGVITAQACYHCGLPVPSASKYPVVIQGKAQPMCCPGCQAVAMAIVDGGLENFYQFRTASNDRPEVTGRRWDIYDLPEVQAEFVIPFDSNIKQANLLLEGISCAACSWLIETHLKTNPAIHSVTVNLSTHRCAIVWDSEFPLSEIFQSLAAIGYLPRPATDDQQQQLIKKENASPCFALASPVLAPCRQ
jgi:Cu2+-exporting ATPase